MSDLSQRLTRALADRYRIERELGQGGMATVFLAEDLKHRRPVALKVLDPEVASAIGPERFLREIETVARLSHPHILALHDSGETGGLLFYVMPYVAGESLRARIARDRQLPLELAWEDLLENPDDLAEFGDLVPAEKRILIPGTGIDTAFFSPAAADVARVEAIRRETGLGAGSVVVTLVGRLLKHKGVEELLAAFTALSARCPESVLPRRRLAG